eukprot:GILI01005214.1.p1 GENE.GILI01005214.1~~GILI01005214.1.p1  ORF type:complete len:405 (-),score=96.86 GILI01005214.1:69-1235(-)
MMNRVQSVLSASNARLFSSSAQLAGIQASKLVVQQTPQPKTKPENKSLVFGRTFTDHMLEVDWNNKQGWSVPRIGPHRKLELDPAASSLHYGLQCFEGMKAYIGVNGDVRLFRPMKNMQRLWRSSQRLCLPTFDQQEFLECVKKLVLLEKDWIPRERGYSLYIRPTAISTTPFLGVGAPSEAKLFVILSPVGPYYPEGFKPISLYADERYVRSWPGGTGDAKVGGNYAPTILPQLEAAQKGYTQVMWLFGPNHDVTEIGTMNQFFFWVNKQGEKELITAPLDGTILPGVTRDCILELARQWGEFKVTERAYSIHEVIETIKDGRLIEAFGAGTAAIVSPVKRFHFHGQDYNCPIDEAEGAGPLARRFAKTIMDIQYGVIPHEWSVKID